MILGILTSIFVVYGCTKKAASSQEAIESAKALPTMEQKWKYLVNQAEAFYNSKEYKERKKNWFNTQIPIRGGHVHRKYTPDDEEMYQIQHERTYATNQVFHK